MPTNGKDLHDAISRHASKNKDILKNMNNLTAAHATKKKTDGIASEASTA